MRIDNTDGMVPDLTRWNRSGLDRFRYIDGAAAEWVEMLRIAHMLLYSRGSSLGTTQSDDPDAWRTAYRTGETAGGDDVLDAANSLGSVWQREDFDGSFPPGADYPQILRAQYDHVGLDQTRQISRAFARAFHVLTESLNAYANEGMLATATQDVHLRRLLEMIAFRPVPAASALVPIALTIDEAAAQQTVGNGLVFEHTPSDGSPILTFEAIETVVADPTANLIRAKDWDSRLDALVAGQSVLKIADASVFSNALFGTFGLLSDGGKFEAFSISKTQASENALTVKRGAVPLGGAYLQTTQVSLMPAHSVAARPTGSYWINFADVPKCWVGQTVALESTSFTGPGGEKLAAKITPKPAVVDLEILTWDNPSKGGVEVTKNAKVLEVRGRDIRIDTTVPSLLKAVYPTIQGTVILTKAEDNPEGVDVLGFGDYIVPDGAAPVGSLEGLEDGYVYFDGEVPEGLTAGLPIALIADDGGLHAGTITALEDLGNGFSLEFKDLVINAKDVAEIHGVFAVETTLVHDIRSDDDLFDAEGRLWLDENDTLRALLAQGRRILIATDPDLGSTDPVAAAFTIASSAGEDDDLFVTVAEDRSALEGLTLGDAVLYGNVLQFGHGKSLPSKVLGSGDNSIMRQSMAIPDTPVATIPASDYPGGIALDVEITVDDRVWQQVAEEGQESDDQPAYVIEIGEDGTPVVTFLRRLTTGADNVVLTRIRKGAGDAGNVVPAFSVRKPKDDVAPVVGLIQPVEPQFGANLQDAAALKAQGNSHFALADRALAVDDFAALAEGYSGVWHASATLRRIAGHGGRATIVLTIVPTGGGSIGGVSAGLSDYLLDRTLPGTTLAIEPYVAAPIGGEMTVTLKSGYAESQAVIDTIRQTLTAHFGLEKRGLGQTLFITEITAAVEAVEAVDNLIFMLTPLWPVGVEPKVVTSAGGAIQAVLPDKKTTVHLQDAADIAIKFAQGGA